MVIPDFFDHFDPKFICVYSKVGYGEEFLFIAAFSPSVITSRGACNLVSADLVVIRLGILLWSFFDNSPLLSLREGVDLCTLLLLNDLAACVCLPSGDKDVGRYKGREVHGPGAKFSQ
jgi:hypothetical protein